jgi:hypothetical protein
MTYTLEIGSNLFDFLRGALVLGVIAYLIVNWWYLATMRGKGGGPR